MGAFETVVLLLKKGANVDSQDRNGMTALHLAARNGLVTVCSFCLCILITCICSVFMFLCVYIRACLLVCVYACVHVCVMSSTYAATKILYSVDTRSVFRSC